MGIQSPEALSATQSKLRELETRLEALKNEPMTNPKTRALTKQTLWKMIKQMKEEIVRYQSHLASTKT
jgi:uncharacterized FlaG/YvyC family protein